MRRTEGEAPLGSEATENNDSHSKVAGCWWPRKVPVRAYHPLHLLRTKPHCLGTKPVPDGPVTLKPLKIKLFLLQHVQSHCFIANSQNSLQLTYSYFANTICTTGFVIIKPASGYSVLKFVTLNINGSFSAATFCTPTYSSILQVLYKTEEHNRQYFV